MHEAQAADSASSTEECAEESDLEKTDRCLATINARLREAARNTFCTSVVHDIRREFSEDIVQKALQRINEIPSLR